jgi:hypothetical protein
MVVYETIVVVNGEVHATIEQEEKAAINYAAHIGWTYLGVAVHAKDSADAVQEVLIDDDRVAYADVAVERRLY